MQFSVTEATVFFSSLGFSFSCSVSLAKPGRTEITSAARTVKAGWVYFRLFMIVESGAGFCEFGAERFKFFFKIGGSLVEAP